MYISRSYHVGVATVCISAGLPVIKLAVLFLQKQIPVYHFLRPQVKVCMAGTTVPCYQVKLWDQLVLRNFKGMILVTRKFHAW